jgi:hypothetical protein
MISTIFSNGFPSARELTTCKATPAIINGIKAIPMKRVTSPIAKNIAGWKTAAPATLPETASRPIINGIAASIVLFTADTKFVRISTDKRNEETARMTIMQYVI